MKNLQTINSREGVKKRYSSYTVGGNVVFPGSSDSKASACNVGDPGSIPGLGKFPGEGNGTPLQYSCLGNARDREAWWATVHGVTRVGHNLVTKPPPQTHRHLATSAPSQ